MNIFQVLDNLIKFQWVWCHAATSFWALFSHFVHAQSTLIVTDQNAQQQKGAYRTDGLWNESGALKTSGWQNARCCGVLLSLLILPVTGLPLPLVKNHVKKIFPLTSQTVFQQKNGSSIVFVYKQCWSKVTSDTIFSEMKSSINWLIAKTSCDNTLNDQRQSWMHYSYRKSNVRWMLWCIASCPVCCCGWPQNWLHLLNQVGQQFPSLRLGGRNFTELHRWGTHWDALTMHALSCMTISLCGHRGNEGRPGAAFTDRP